MHTLSPQALVQQAHSGGWWGQRRPDGVERVVNFWGAPPSYCRSTARPRLRRMLEARTCPAAAAQPDWADPARCCAAGEQLGRGAGGSVCPVVSLARSTAPGSSSLCLCSCPALRAHWSFGAWPPITDLPPVLWEDGKGSVATPMSCFKRRQGQRRSRRDWESGSILGKGAPRRRMVVLESSQQACFSWPVNHGPLLF